jgi:hypothetical protein
MINKCIWTKKTKNIYTTVQVNPWKFWMIVLKYHNWLVVTGTWLLFSVSYMGCHPSHWRTPLFFKMVIAPPTRSIWDQSWLSGFAFFPWQLIQLSGMDHGTSHDRGNPRLLNQRHVRMAWINLFPWLFGCSWNMIFQYFSWGIRTISQSMIFHDYHFGFPGTS